MLTEEETVALVTGAEPHALFDLQYREDLAPRARMPDGEGLLHYGIRTGRCVRYMGALGLAIDINGAGLLQLAVQHLLKALAPFEDETTIRQDDPKDFWRTFSFIYDATCQEGNENLQPHRLLGITAEEAEVALAPLREAASAQPGAEPWDVECGVGSYRAGFYYMLSHSQRELNSPARTTFALEACARWSPHREAWISAVVRAAQGRR